ncbi:uncharacterized protein LOC134459616 [Engraulis encrasicolus]|uniref:uncharacterized protein LOC134459616 n=1 Tax=Engraulis encrasicolus TaxID=184585 RepID=UPI002FCFE889
MDDAQAVYLLLCLCSLGVQAAAGECMRALEGGSFAIRLNSTRQQGDVLTWKLNLSIPVYQRRKEHVTGDGSVNDDGDLLLGNLTSSMSGTYRAEHHGRDGRLIKAITKELCVVAKVPVPTLSVACSSSGAGTLHCVPGGTKGFSSITWFHNNVEMKEKVNPLHLTELRENGRYRCRLTNDLLMEDKRDSDDVTMSCSASSVSPWLRAVLTHVISVSPVC